MRVLAVLILLGALSVLGTVANSTPEHLSARSSETSYGGDAYTGIQNAASDTENTVVDAAYQQMDDMHDVKVLLAYVYLGAAFINITLAVRPRA